jgi:hypothetical protein
VFGAKLRQAKLALSVGLAASPAYKRELDKRLQAFDRAVWVRLLATPITFVSALAPTLRWQGVHNSGPMPGEDEDDLWVESTQDDAPPNVKCPLTGKGVLELEEPVRCVLCKPQRRRTCSCPRVFPPCTAQGSEGLRVREGGYSELHPQKGRRLCDQPKRWCAARALRLRHRALTVCCNFRHAGVSQYITASELVPAKQVIREAKRKQLASQQVRAWWRAPSGRRASYLVRRRRAGRRERRARRARAHRLNVLQRADERAALCCQHMHERFRPVPVPPHAPPSSLVSWGASRRT